MRREAGLLFIMLLLAACSNRRTIKVPTTTANPPAAPALAAVVPKKFEGTILAIMPLNNNTGDGALDRTGRTLAEVMSAELAGRAELRLVERARLNEVLRELNLSESAVINQAGAVRAGRLLGADQMVFGSFSNLGEGSMLTARVVRVDTGEIINAVTQKGMNHRDLDVMARAAIREALSASLRETPHGEAADADEIEDGLLAATHPNSQAIGVVISVRNYKSKDVPAAEYAEDDARLMKRYLTRSLGFRDENLIELKDPTKAELEMVFGTESDAHGRLAKLLEQRAPKDREVFVYYSGHGAPSLKTQRSYLVPSDAQPDYIDLNGYSRDLLLKNVGMLGTSRATVVLEACFSGNSSGGMLLHEASPLTLRVAEADIPNGVSVIAAASSEQVASWYGTVPVVVEN